MVSDISLVLAQAIHSVIPNEELIFFGPPCEQQFFHSECVTESVEPCVHAKIHCVRSLPTVELRILNHSAYENVHDLLKAGELLILRKLGLTFHWDRS